jgi:isoleucyl-tRNA synthetase
MSDKNTLQNLTNQTFPEIENEVLQYWKQEKIFERVTEMRKGAPSYRFIDGPPFPNDVPHYGHFLCSVAKDIIPRFHTMKGRSVRRVFGWDCHGLPIEEKLNGKLGIKGSESKQKIEQEIGVNQYIEKCRGLVGENIESWRFYMDKLGRWSDMDNAYKTMDANFGESIMWAFKTLWDKGLIYKGKRTSLYSTDSGTPVSDFEVNMDPDNYKETEDVSIYMKFQLENASVEKLSLATNGSLSGGAISEKVFMLAWTTTPWTLYANFALAINQDEQYTVLKYTNASSESEYLIVAKKLAENVKTVCQKELLNVEECLDLPGKSLVGLKYNQYISELSSTNENDFCIYHGDFVSTEDGTGIVHIAPAYGADDFELGKKFNISDKGSIDDTGHMVVGTFKGRYLRDANLDIAKELLSQGKALKVKAYKHRLPYYRTNNPLIYKTQEGWFVNIQKMKPRMIDLIDTSTWVPENIKEGRWRNTIESSPDWCISRDRYWNTIMPVWANVEDTEDYYIPGSFADSGEIFERCCCEY